MWRFIGTVIPGLPDPIQDGEQMRPRAAFRDGEGWDYARLAALGYTWEADAVAPSLDDAYAAQVAAIRDAAEAVLAPLGLEYGATERATWDQQYAEAQAVLADPEAAAPLLTAIATARGQSVADLAARVVDNRARWVVLSGAVVGQRLAYQDQLDAAYAAEDVAAILAVSPVFTLPDAG